MGLHVHVLGTVDALGAVDGYPLDFVNKVAATVIAGTGIALGVFVRQMAAHGLHHRFADKVL